VSERMEAERQLHTAHDTRGLAPSPLCLDACLAACDLTLTALVGKTAIGSWAKEHSRYRQAGGADFVPSEKLAQHRSQAGLGMVTSRSLPRRADGRLTGPPLTPFGALAPCLAIIPEHDRVRHNRELRVRFGAKTQIPAL